jgi:hypothetical protein
MLKGLALKKSYPINEGYPGYFIGKRITSHSSPGFVGIMRGH